MTEQRDTRIQFSENVWLALLPVAGTYIAFLFQASYFSYFGVPVSMVNIDIPKIIFSMAAIALAGVLLVTIFAFVADLLRSQNPIVKIIGRGLTVVVFFLPFILAATEVFTARQLIAYGLISITAWVLNFWPPPQNPGEKKSYMERLTEQEDERHKLSENKPINVKQAVGESVVGPFSLFFFGSIYVLMLGAYCASMFGSHSYLEGNKDALYAGKIDGAYVFTIVDPKNNTFGHQILLLDSGSSVELVRSDRRVIRSR